jgi:hypothetical protein
MNLILHDLLSGMGHYLFSVWHRHTVLAIYLLASVTLAAIGAWWTEHDPRLKP